MWRVGTRPVTARREADGGYRVDVSGLPPVAYCRDRGCTWRDHTVGCSKSARRHSRETGHIVVLERMGLSFLVPPEAAAKLLAKAGADPEVVADA